MTQVDKGHRLLIWAKREFLRVGTLLGLLSLAAGVYLFYASEKSPEISFQRSVVQVFDSRSSSPSITVSDDEGVAIETNVYAAEFVIWNSGSAPVEKIRKPLEIIALGDARILDFELLAQTEEVIAKFTVKEKAGPTGQILHVSWGFFDPGYGLKVRVVYAAEDANDMTVSGYVFPSGPVIDQTEPIFKRRHWSTTTIIVVAGLIVAFVFMRIVNKAQLSIKLKSERYTTVARAVTMFSGGIALGILSSLAYVYYFERLIPPPL